MNPAPPRHPLEVLAASLEALAAHLPPADRPPLYRFTVEWSAARRALFRALEALGAGDRVGATLAYAEALGAVDAAGVVVLELHDDADDDRGAA